MFKIDYNNAGFKPITPGEYEVIPTKYDITTAQTSGNTRLIVNYEIRTDVSQDCQGQEIRFDNFTVAENSMWRFNQAAKAAMIPDGMVFETLQDWAEAFKGLAVRVVVGEREHNGQKYPQVTMFKETKYPLGNVYGAQKNNDPFPDNGKPIDISDDDLPF